MTTPEPGPGPADPRALAAQDVPQPDPLSEVQAALETLADVALDDHPDVFGRIDANLRAALDGGAAPARG